MALSWNEIRDRSLKFSKEWEGEGRERAEKDSFWNEFFHVFGISRRRIASFEEPVKKLNEHQGFIDLFWKGTLIVEHKSRGKNLDKAYSQALDYFAGLNENELPRYVLVSDFEKFRVYDLEEGTENNFDLKDLHKNIKLFGFIAGYKKQSYAEQDPVNIKAAEMMGKLHDQLEESGFEGHELEVYLVRLVFCLFADNSGIFETNTLLQYIELKTNEDGSDFAMHFAKLFQVLDTPEEKRSSTLDEDLKQFPYVNGRLFEEVLRIPDFTSKMRKTFIDSCYLDWAKISPAIFGSLFQSVMNPEERRNLGAHYTSEKNILKLIKPLFLDELYVKFNKVKSNTRLLKEFHNSLSKLKFLDPACGSGNFLVITYRELRLLELKILRVLYKGQTTTNLESIVWIDVDQFYGIEYDEWPSKIAEVAMWLMDHQMNMVISEEFGHYFARLPLRKAAKIVNGNALRVDWEEVVPKDDLSYILGNPPFSGKQLQTKEQKSDMNVVFRGVKGAGVLDYVTAWYIRAAQYIEDTKIKVAFVSTNSIAQGEQVAILWKELKSKYKIKIFFAHRTFRWKNEAKGNAAVHVVILGFSNFDIIYKYIFEYEDVNEEPHVIKAKNVNSYLVDSDDLIILKRRSPICAVSEISFGNMPNDGGNYLFSDEEKKDFINSEPSAKHYFRPLLSAREYLNGKKRWCLWLKDIAPSDLKSLKLVQERVQNVKNLRDNSSRAATRKLAAFPTLFGEIRQPKTEYILIPRHSSENRKYIPMGFFAPHYIASDSCLSIDNASLYDFGMLQSEMHMTWVKYICGRIKSDYRYSNEMVYNNFPWPKDPSEKNKKVVDSKAQKVLDVRAKFPKSSLADLYGPLTMPPKLVKAHQELDKAVDLCYRPQAFTNESGRIEYLFDLYNYYTNPLFAEKKSRKSRKGQVIHVRK